MQKPKIMLLDNVFYMIYLNEKYTCNVLMSLVWQTDIILIFTAILIFLIFSLGPNSNSILSDIGRHIQKQTQTESTRDPRTRREAFHACFI